MKIKSLLLAGLAGFALASCGGISGYKTQVAKETFAKDLEKALEDNMSGVEKPYSFEIRNEEGLTLTKKWTKDNKQLYEEKTNSGSSKETKYDSVNMVLTEKGKGYNKDVVSKQNLAYDIEQNYVTQVDVENMYTIDQNAKVYTKDKMENPELSIQLSALAKIQSVKMTFFKFLDSKTAKFFEDGNKFTAEDIKNTDESSYNEYQKEVYQLVINKNGYEFNTTQHRETTTLNSKTIEDSYETKSFARKDGLKLDKVDLHNVLEVDTLPNVLLPL